MQIEYTTSVYTAAGWRSVTITAEVEQTSKAMATVTKVIAINGEAPGYGMSRTGANRQKFNGNGIAQREVGARKRLTACTVL